MKQRLKRWIFRLLGKDPERVVVDLHGYAPVTLAAAPVTLAAAVAPLAACGLLGVSGSVE